MILITICRKKLMYRYLYTCWKLMMQNFPPPPLQVSAVSCVWEESLWYTYNRRRHMNTNGFPIGCRQIFCPRQPIECFVSKRHYSNVTDRKGMSPYFQEQLLTKIFPIYDIYSNTLVHSSPHLPVYCMGRWVRLHCFFQMGILNMIQHFMHKY